MTGRDDEGAWIFVSHSHRDLETVRKVRNYLEEKGHNPLLFYLKCLTDDDARLPELIRDEIKSRNWFVLCDGPNARRSRYVPEEVALVDSLDEKIKETIDLSQELEPQLYKLDRLLKRATVYLSYSHKDLEIAKRISAAFRMHEYRVWMDLDDLRFGQDWREEMRRVMDDALGNGFVLLLLSGASLRSDYTKYETHYALEVDSQREISNVVPILLESIPPEVLPPQLSRTLAFDLSTGPFEQRIEELIRQLKKREMA